MGKPATATREYISDAEVFADVFNYYAFGGRKVIEAQNLEELDTSALLTVFGKDGDELRPLMSRQETNTAEMNLCPVCIRMMGFYL